MPTMKEIWCSLTCDTHSIAPVQNIPDHGSVCNAHQSFRVLVRDAGERAQAYSRTTEYQSLEARLRHTEHMRHLATNLLKWSGCDCHMLALSHQENFCVWKRSNTPDSKSILMRTTPFVAMISCSQAQFPSRFRQGCAAREWEQSGNRAQ